MGSNPSPIVLLLVIFVVTCVLTNFMSNTATTALMVPIAVSLAESLNADPRAVVIATVIAGSCAYATPIGMPANTMVVGVGGYKFKDYVKIRTSAYTRIVCAVYDFVTNIISVLSIGYGGDKKMLHNNAKQRGLKSSAPAKVVAFCFAKQGGLL